MQNLIVTLLMVVCFAMPSIGQTWECGLVHGPTRSEQELQFAASARQRSAGGAVRTIPTVVHIISSSPTATSNIQDNQVDDQIQILTRAFRGQFGGTDTQVEFCLAGITRTFDPSLSHVVLGANGNELAMKQAVQIDPETYYNIYVVESIANGANTPVGFTFPPVSIIPNQWDFDGTIILHDYFGSIGTGATHSENNLGRILVHEAGHWLNLYHPFGTCDYSWNCESENDCCCDTPPVPTADAAKKCNRARNTCQTDSPDLDNPNDNYMMLTADNCRVAFTPCQSMRINYTLDVLRTRSWFLEGECPAIRAQPLSENRPWTISVYPNPFTNNLLIDFGSQGVPESPEISLHDLSGKRLAHFTRKAELSQVGTTISIDLNCPSGIYVLSVQGVCGIQNFKVVKQ